MITAVFFDLDGTIRQNLPPGGEVFADYASQLGLRLRQDDRVRAERWEHFYWANSRELLDDRSRFDGNEAEFWYRYALRRLVALGASTPQAVEMAPKIHLSMKEYYKPQSVVPEDARRLLPQLLERGYKLAVVSNRAQSFRQELDSLGLSPFFPYALAGGEINAWKPEPEIFLHACKQLQVTPDETMYVGDNYFADVVGAKRAGLTPVLYDPHGVFDEPEAVSIKSFDELPGLLAPSMADFGKVSSSTV